MNYNLNKNDNPVYTISVAAKLLEISIHTLRMYEREGLIIPFKTKGNQRLYTENDIERIVSIRKDMKELKMSIKSIRALLSMVPCYRIINCSNEDRKNCAVYHENNKPCWVYKHKNNICESIDCRECEVYINHYDFVSTNNTLKKML